IDDLDGVVSQRRNEQPVCGGTKMVEAPLHAFQRNCLRQDERARRRRHTLLRMALNGAGKKKHQCCTYTASFLHVAPNANCVSDFARFTKSTSKQTESAATESELTLSTPRCQWDSRDRKSTRLNSSHVSISYAVFCLKKKITMYYVMHGYSTSIMHQYLSLELRCVARQ